MAGMIAKYFATSLAMENVVRAPRVINNCLPMATTSINLVGSESRSTMLPASLAADVPLFMATPTSAAASAGASLVPSPVIATIRPPACSRRIRAILSSGVASARKSSTPASSAIALAVSGLSPVIITVRMPIARSWANRSVIPGLTTSRSAITPSTRPDSSDARPGWCRMMRSATTRGVPPSAAIASTMGRSSAGAEPSHCWTAEPAPLRISRLGRSTPDIRVWAVNGTNSGAAGQFVVRRPQP